MNEVMKMPDQEVNALQYLSFSAQTSYLVVGLSCGKICALDLATMDACFTEETELESEITHLHYMKPKGDAASKYG